MSDHSVTQMLHNLREGHDVTRAQAVIWERFFHRLRALAEQRIDGRTRRIVDGEDIAVEALHDFFSQMQQKDAFPQLSDRESLWPLLARITSRKAINEFKRATAQKRGGGEVRGESVFVNAEGDPEMARGIEQIERELTPEYADELFLGFAGVLDELRGHDPIFYEVAVLKLKGFSSSEIAEKLGFESAKTPDRIIKKVRILWKSHYGGLAVLSVVQPTSVKFATNLNEEPTVVGRQRMGEQEPFWTGTSDFQGQATRRVVVATNAQKSVSRNHATIQIQDEHQILIRNTSRKSKIVINSERVLEPEESWTSPSDCTLRLTEQVLLRIQLN